MNLSPAELDAIPAPGDMPALTWLPVEDGEPDGATYALIQPRYGPALILYVTPWHARPGTWGAEVTLGYIRIARAGSVREGYPSRAAAQEAAWKLAAVWGEGLRRGLA